MRSDPSYHWDIYEEHLDEASFLWAQWERALVSASHSLADVQQLEERLWAHLDGLVLGGAPTAERLLLPALAEEDSPRVSAAAFALLAERDEPVGQVLAVLEQGEPPQREGIRRALELIERGALAGRLAPLLESPRPEARAAALEVLAFRRVDPGAALAKALLDLQPAVRGAAWRALRAAPGAADRDGLRRALGASVPELRDEALEAAAVLGLKAAWPACRKAADEQAPPALALALLAMGGEARELELLRARLEEPAVRGLALWALGLSGRLAAAEACLPYLGDADAGVARLAAEAFCAITGLVLEGDLLAPPAPEPEEPVPLEEEDLDASLVPASEEALPLANPGAVEAWWRQARKDFSLEGRYLYGKPFEQGWLGQVLARAPMRRRHALALELAVRTRGRYQLETRGTVARQLRQLEELRALSGVRFLASFRNLLTVD